MSGILVRTTILGALAALELLLFSGTHYYATMLVVALLGVIIAFDLRHCLATRLSAPAPLEAPDPRSRSMLARELDHAHALLDTVPAALFVLDGERIVFTNRSAAALAREHAAHLEQVPALGVAAARRLALLRPGAREIVQLADGSSAYVTCAAYVVPGAAERRLLALQRIAGELDVVEQRAWSDMARVLAHEMMNSLTPIASLSDSLGKLLHGREGEDELLAALEVIQRRSHGLMNFVERYRAVAELPAPRPRRLLLQPFLADMERLMSASLREQRVEFSTRILPPDAAVSADAEMLEHALINLLRNAVEALEGVQCPAIEIECSVEGGAVAIDVHDNGHGLPDNLNDVLTPFFSTKNGGGGIGLNVARHVALAHGGQLNVRRRITGGATFSLVLPAA